MIVTTQNKGLSITGLRIGPSNVRRYFRADVTAIDLELDHLRIRCDLQPAFWSDQPEISDPRLCSWLQNKFSRDHMPGIDLSLEMIRTGDSYRLTARCAPRRAQRHLPAA